MNYSVSIRRFVLRFAALLLLAEVSIAFAQSPTLPATAPTTAAGTPAVATTPEQSVTHRAKVVFSEGQLSIVADNSSLNQILRDISRQTGMKITGGVTEQRVFGKYGPGSPSVILATLIDGTGSNMLLRYGPSHVPVELVLTPRMGGDPPPSPDAPQYNDPGDTPAPAPDASQSAAPPVGQQTQPSTQPTATQGSLVNSYFFGSPEAATNYTPASSGSTQPASSTQPSSSTPSAGGASYPPSPNGVKTPPQITQGLQQLPH
jgi:hypothetical protein